MFIHRKEKGNGLPESPDRLLKNNMIVIIETRNADYGGVINDFLGVSGISKKGRCKVSNYRNKGPYA